MKLLIIADDLTGALEAGALCGNHHRDCPVISHKNLNAAAALQSASAMTIDSESRHVTPATAARRIKKIMQQALACGFTHFYKKTDSTLRGNIGSEFAALLSNLPAQLDSQSLVYIPAYPKLGRTCRNGHLFLHDEPLDQSAFSQDCLSPVTDNSVADILKAHCKYPIVSTENNRHLAMILRKKTKNSVIVCDAITEKDIAAITRILHSENALQLVGGPAGILEHLLKWYDLPTRKKSPPKPHGKTLIVSGSLNETSLAQIQFACSQGIPHYTLDPAQVFDHAISWLTLQKEIQNAFHTKELLILKTVTAKSELPKYLQQAQKAELKDKHIYEAAARRIGKIVQKLVATMDIGTLIIFGGETTRGILDALPCQTLTPTHEIMPGIPVSHIQMKEKQLTLLTKAGGYGKIDVLPQVLRSR